MEKMRLGKTELMVSRSGFGCIPIQRLSDEDSTALLRAAYEGGINYFDTARGYTTSEHKIGLALGDVRDKIIISSKTHAETAAEFDEDLEKTLSELGCDYVDIIQFHNPSFIPVPGGEDGVYDAALRAKAAGKVRHIGITSHKVALAKEMVKSGYFETMQYPMSCLASEEEVELTRLCAEYDVGFIGMKGLAGGLITNAKPTFAFVHSLGNVVPIWGMEHMWQLEEFLGYEKNPPALDDDMWEVIRKDRAELAGDFCRSCGYCLPCPANINIPQAARMTQLLGRMEWHSLVTKSQQLMMENIENCVNCRHCADNCPYHLNTPELLKSNLTFYRKFVEEKGVKAI